MQCVSNYYAQLKGRSEKELHLISAELYQRKRQQGQNIIHSDTELVQFLNSVGTTEEQLVVQHLKAVENQRVIKLITNNLELKDGVEVAQSGSSDSNRDAASNINDNSNRNILGSGLIDLESEQLEYYGEF